MTPGVESPLLAGNRSSKNGQRAHSPAPAGAEIQAGISLRHVARTCTALIKPCVVLSWCLECGRFRKGRMRMRDGRGE